MAAYASVVSLALTIENFAHHHHHRVLTSFVGDLDMDSLKAFVNFLQAILDDSPDRVTTDLEGRIRDASCAAEDLIEYLMLGSRNLHKLYSELEGVAQMIASIVGEVTDIESNTTRSSKDEIMVGFDADLLAIKTRLCGGYSRLEIIPICGMGGIGKTTLARNAYEDPSTTHRFHVRAWVTVSQDYEALEVLSRLQDPVKADVKGQSGQSNEAVYKSLKGRRYLIVLDDMWSTKVWDDVKRLFPDDNNGSRIMLTTRLANVAAYVDSSSHFHEMRPMDVDCSWQLLQQKLFKDKPCPPQSEKIGRTIAGSCKGLPLAIVVVAGILSTISRIEALWEKVASKVISTLTANADDITKIFSLSYTHLPHHLRPCFLYMGGFPEDHEIHVSKLIKLWTAEGFMKPGGSKSFEDVAEEYLDDLVKRHLVLVVRRKFNGKIKSCSIHYLLRELCIKKALEENFILYDDEGTVNLGGRRISNKRRSIAGDRFHRYGSTVHSVLFFHGFLQYGSLKRFRLTRVLDVINSHHRQFPDYVLELYLLRYLAFTFDNNNSLGTNDFDVPRTISKLENLQTLIIFPSDRRYSRKIRVRLPPEIFSMRRLRHLHVVGTVVVPLPEPYPVPFGLQDLQTLATVEDFRCTERVLQMIPNLKKLGIIYYYDARRGMNWAEYRLDNLVRLHHLEKLSIHVMSGIFQARVELRFPATLKKLKLQGLRLSKQDMEIIGSLPNLEVLKLINCNIEDFKWETTEGEFPKLKVLKISLMDLKVWITERSHFPSLNHLHLTGCDDLDDIPEEIGEITTLELIEVNKENRSVVESALQIQEKQQSYGNDSLQVRILDW